MALRNRATPARQSAGSRSVASSFNIDLTQKEISKGELRSVAQAVGGLAELIDEKAKDSYAVALLQHTPESMLLDKLLENQQVLRVPIVRNGRQATVGYAPDVWKSWE